MGVKLSNYQSSQSSPFTFEVRIHGALRRQDLVLGYIGNIVVVAVVVVMVVVVMVTLVLVVVVG
jgi:hypothetical protein